MSTIYYVTGNLKISWCVLRWPEFLTELQLPAMLLQITVLNDRQFRIVLVIAGSILEYLISKWPEILDKW